jgi:hypothetical protein
VSVAHVTLSDGAVEILDLPERVVAAIAEFVADPTGAERRSV